MYAHILWLCMRIFYDYVCAYSMIMYAHILWLCICIFYDYGCAYSMIMYVHILAVIHDLAYWKREEICIFHCAAPGCWPLVWVVTLYRVCLFCWYFSGCAISKEVSAYSRTLVVLPAFMWHYPPAGQTVTLTSIYSFNLISVYGVLCNFRKCKLP